MNWDFNVIFYGQILLKLVVTVILMLVYVRVSGKSQLAPMTAFDQIGNIIVGAIGGTTLLNTNISVLDSTVFISLWIMILVIIRLIRAKSQNFKELLDGRRLQLVKDRAVLSENFKKANLPVGNMAILMHRDGVKGLCEVENIWFEPNGQLTIDKRNDAYMSVVLIEDGKINEQQLKELGKNEKWLSEQLKHNSVYELEQVFYAEWVLDKLWVYPYL